MATRILIVEDEGWAVDSLSEMLSDMWKDDFTIEVKATVRDAIDWLTKHKADLIFMDIHLGDGLSFDIFDSIKVKTPIIFTTAYEEYALQAFQNNGYAYLLKPFDQEELHAAVAKVQPLISRAQHSSAYKNRFLVKYGVRLKSIRAEDIAYFMAEDKLLYGFSVEGEKFIVDETITKLISKLDPRFFFQINRKFIVHIQSIVEMIKISRNRIRLKLNPDLVDDIEVVVTEEKSNEFQMWLDK